MKLDITIMKNKKLHEDGHIKKVVAFYLKKSHRKSWNTSGTDEKWI